ncbi:4619_t:CDS:2 [Entrophospora sp. SA101]|nr:4619_t:CDS:2 [Entrophospora sp. SA101]
MVMEYLRKQNRPYSATDVINNLRGAVTKTVAQKVLNSLVEKNEVNCKPYGKQSVYCIKQFNGLNSSLTNKQIDERIEIVKEENQKYGERLQVLQSGTIQISDEEKKQIDEGYEKNRKLWRQRKRMVEMYTLYRKKENGFYDPVEIDEDPLKDL